MSEEKIKDTLELPTDEFKKTFETVASRWESQFYRIPSHIRDEDYRQLVNMGKQAIPLILEHMQINSCVGKPGYRFYWPRIFSDIVYNEFNQTIDDATMNEEQQRIAWLSWVEQHKDLFE